MPGVAVSGIRFVHHPPGMARRYRFATSPFLLQPA